ncbi:hypothetical protein RLOC_00014070 [Lonchura striata]|uniref:Uncharacterized protein n=1 Tax=Lonchura striata TaxID=40157 RepID=A0A218UYS4_9PASE|nr:hypothetical protein RLOC_00014070 [Lonchura striata domestica]
MLPREFVCHCTINGLARSLGCDYLKFQLEGAVVQLIRQNCNRAHFKM